MTANNYNLRIEDYTDEQLKALSLEKRKNGIATNRALKAQDVLWNRAGQPFQSSAHFERDMTPVKKI